MATIPETGRVRPVEEPLVGPGQNMATVSDAIGGIPLNRRPPLAWLVLMPVAMLGVLLLFGAVAYLLYKGIGIWGVNIPVAWGWAITNFVWWIGIGHAGTLISAILLLLHQEWRTSINRFAEAMTLFAVACAGLFPLLHVGRPWIVYFIFPYPDTMDLWPQFRSPLVWDVFAVSTYATISLVFWYVGLIPDLATVRDRAKGRVARVLYGITSLGWRGSAVHWHRYDMVYLLLAGLATPLVVSVHSVVSLDFAVGIIPGWHSTIFPPYFVAGAIFSGFAMVLTLVIPARAIWKLHDFVTDKHLDNMAMVMLVNGLVVFYGYLIEAFMGWFAADTYEQYSQTNRMLGPYAPYYWTLIFCNCIVPQILWFKRIRRRAVILFAASLLINLGMWLERFVIVVTSLHRDFLPSSWGIFHGTRWDWATFLGTLGFFLFCMLLFLKFVPMIAIHEMRALTIEQNGGEADAEDVTTHGSTQFDPPGTGTL